MRDTPKRKQLRRLLFESLERRVVLSSIHGHKFWDFDENGLDDVGEPGLDGVSIQVRNRDGLTTASQLTHSSDMNGDGVIDPELESGLFWITNVPEGVYTVVEEDIPGLRQTYPQELTFDTPRTFAAGLDPVSIDVVDVNADQVSDMILLDGGSLVVRLGLEGFLFDDPLAFPVADGHMLDAALGNFNGDALVDVAVSLAHPGGDQVAIFVNQGNDGNGQWQGFALNAQHAVGQLPRSVKADDFNADGLTDLVVASDGQNQLDILLGDGRGGMAPGQPINLPPPVAGADFTFGFVDAGDINLDGFPDLVVDGPGQLVTILNFGRNEFGGIWLGFGPPTQVSVPGRPANVRLADLNADERLDVVYADPAGDRAGVLLNTSTGDGRVTFDFPMEFLAGPVPSALDVADLNRDTIPDLIVGNATDNESNVHVLLGDGGGQFTDGIPLLSGPAIFSVSTGDANGDGNVDILAGRSDGSVDPLSLIANTMGQHTVVIESPEEIIEDIVFGNGGEFDWGDAPDSYHTVLVSSGPRHVVTLTSPKLGAVVTTEKDGKPHVEALGDGGDDGILFPLPLLPGVQSAVTVFPTGGGTISGWLDLNRDGVFSNVPIEAGGEKIINNVAIGAPTSFVFDIPNDALSLDYSRFRFSSSGGLAPFGSSLPDGEVEDHITLDFGDAPESYGTRRASNGPRHRFTSNVWLGQGVDVEQDGRPHVEARGDDQDGNDDEDGVSFPLPMIPGQESAVTVEPSTRGFVFGWIDFNGDGVFDETPVEAGGEKIFDGVEVTGPTSLLFDVPDDATDLKYARFRFTSTEGLKLASKGLAPDGSIPDGEVEDYVLLDFGDAPASYATTLASDGPRHFVKPNVFLGASDSDMELDGQPHAEAQGDDTDNTDDEDGITFLTPLHPGETAQIEVDASAAGFLFGWLDFNNDGQFQDAPVAAGGERVFSAQPVTSAANQKLEFTVPAGADIIKFARFRFTTEAGMMLGPSGVKPDGTPPIGEVEDYALLDFGDAPDKEISDRDYPTRRRDDGARHFISTLFLGVLDPPEDGPTVDDDGQPNRHARADKNEESVVFSSMIVPGMPAEIKVKASKEGHLDAFLDWNADGDWDDDGEQIFEKRKLDAGENTLTFAVPEALEAGIKYLRFRLSTDGGLGPTGLADDGEVEDYALGGIVNSTQDDGDKDLTDGLCDTGNVITRPGNGTDGQEEPECTLRAAIEQSNALGAHMGIEFDIPRNDSGFQDATNSFKISPATPLPTVTKPVEIDATTQPGYSDKPIIEIDGASLAEGSNGLHVTAGETTIRGFAINGLKEGNAILLESNGKNLIEQNFLGTDVLGEEAKANGVGVRIVGVAENIIQDNLISGNATIGVEITGNEARDNQLLGNLIGTDVDGLQAIPNMKHGVVVREASSNRIGGLAEGDGNVISGNGDNSSFTVGGILIQGTANQLGDDARDNTIEGNIIGPNKEGNAKLTSSEGLTGNSFVGIAIINASHNIIGGTTLAARNIISANLRGIHIEGTGDSGSDAHENKVQGNFIGTTRRGDERLGNGDSGIRIVDSSRNEIGGIVAGASPSVGSAPGNVISGNLTAIDILGRIQGSKNTASENLVQGNLIGTNADGTAAVANFIGISIRSASNNTIGGSVTGARNVVSGNTQDGIIIQASGGSSTGNEASGNKIQGNYIGVGINGSRTGSTDLGNRENGIKIVDGRANIIGGPTATDGAGDPSPGTAPGNVIADNEKDGIKIQGASDSTIIQGNIVGADATGKIDLGNLYGIRIDKASKTTIGGTTPAMRNLVSGNDIIGIELGGPNSSQNVVQGNYIGTQLDGTSRLGNGLHGVFVIFSDSNVIGGTTGTEAGACKGACNIIAYNGIGSTIPANGHGVVIHSGTKNSIRRNSIFDNAGRGIDLGDDSFTLNDLKDDDVGANDLQDYPVVTSVTFTGLLFKSITWTLNSAPHKKYTLDFFSNIDPDPSGFGEGRFYLGSVDVTTNAEGNISTTQLFSPSALFVSATATDPDGNTSEFSMVDTDGDALADAWETQGTDVDGDGTVEPWEMGTLDFNEDGTNDHVTPTFLPALGGTPAANLFHKDLYVEVDTMLGAGLAQPNQATLNVVANGQAGMNDGFANAPLALVNNPDLRNGIALHAILSDTNIAHRTFAGNGWAEFDVIKRASFGNPARPGVASERAGANRDNILAAKRLAYRYALFGDRRVGNSISGVGELPLDHEIAFFGGNDFIVNLGGWTPRGGTAQQQQGTFMHELGHTLGLRHGGSDDNTYKPNYYSSMNYMWQTPAWYLPNWTLDYSRVNFGPLNETGLAEADGVITTRVAADIATANAIAATRSVLIGGRSTRDTIADHLDPPPPPPLPRATVRAAAGALVVPMMGSVDWSRLKLGPFAGIPNRPNVIRLANDPLPHDDDGRGGTDPDANTGLMIDINGDGAQTSLPGHEDWSKLRFYFLESEQGFRDGVHDESHDDEDFYRPEDEIAMDYGDAPAPYPTRFDDDGPRHSIPGPNTPILGQRVDLDPDGQPDAQALGDDLADGNDLSHDLLPDEPDDEDGVVFDAPLVPGASAAITVTVQLPAGVLDEALLDAWVDFNADGDWDDAGEQVFTNTVVVHGENSLSIPVPSTASGGTTFTRFRLSTEGGLSPTGEAADGEVEDYAVEIAAMADVDLRQFTTDASVSLATTMISYEIAEANASEFQIAFYTSDSPRYDSSAVEVGQRITISAPADLTVGMHSLLVEQSALEALLTDADVAYLLAVADPDDSLLESDETNNDQYFVGVFHRPASPAPVAVRGKDPAGRDTSDAADVVAISSNATTASLEFNGEQHTLAVEDVSTWLVRTHGGDDRLAMEGLQSYALLAGLGNDTLTLNGSGQSLDLEALAGSALLGIESIDLRGTGPNALTLSVAEVVNLSDSKDPSAALLVRHDEDDEVNYGAGWTVDAPTFADGEALHVLQGEQAELRIANTRPWRNPLLPLDVNRDGFVAPSDVLAIVNTINGQGARQLSAPTSQAELPRFYYDANGDTFVAPNDALIAINFLNSSSGGEGETAHPESAARAFDLAPVIALRGFAAFEATSREATEASRHSRLRHSVAIDRLLGGLGESTEFWASAKEAFRPHRQATVRGSAAVQPSELNLLADELAYWRHRELTDLLPGPFEG